MATAKTKSDAIGIYLTDPRGLGGDRSAVEFQPLEPVISAPIPPLIIERIGGANTAGRGTIVAANNSLVYTAPGDTAGAAVTVAANTSALLESGTPGKSIRVYRDSVYSDAAMSGTMYVDLRAGLNNAVALGNATQAGSTEYGCVWLRNNSAVAVTGVSVQAPATGYTLGTEAPPVQTIADAATAPTAITFATSQAIGTLEPGESVAVWIKRVVAAATAVSLETLGGFDLVYTYDAVEYTETLSGYYRIANAALDRYELYIGEGAAPNFAAAPAATSATLPFSHALTAEATTNWAVRRRNAYDLVSLNTLTESVVVGVGGADETPALTDPEIVSTISVEGGEVDLRLRYNYSLDAMEADTWRLYITTDGTDPDPATDPETDHAMVVFGLMGAYQENVIRLGPYDYGSVVKVVARVYSSTLDAESQSVAVSSVTVSTQAPVGPHLLGVSMGGFRGMPQTLIERTSYYNSPTNTVGIHILDGETVLFGTGDAFRAEYDLFRTGLEFVNATLGGAGTSAAVEAVSATEFYINVGSVRLCKIDLTAGTITGATFQFTETAIDLPVIGPIHATAAATYIMVRNRVTGRWTPAIKVGSDGVVAVTAAVLQEIA